MIDLHCHILPGVDDGPRTLLDSLEVASAAVDDGVRMIVATPHVSSRYPNESPDIAGALAQLQRGLVDSAIDLEVSAGAEIAISRLPDLSDEELCALHLGDGPWLLLEAPPSPVAADLEAALEAVHRRGHWIVLAHPERSPLFLRDPRRLGAIVASGVLCSVTAGSLTGRFGVDARRLALALVREGLVHSIASDAHDARRRPPRLRQPILASVAHAPELSLLAQWLTEEVPRAIVEGDALPAAPRGSSRAAPPGPRSFGRRAGRRWRRDSNGGS